MASYTLVKFYGKKVHVHSAVLNDCPVERRMNGFDLIMQYDSINALQAAMEIWGDVCKNCRKNVEAVTNQPLGYNTGTACSNGEREMPSLEEIADEAPAIVMGKLTHVVTWTFEGNTFDSFHTSEEFANNKADKVRADGGENVLVEACAVIAARVAARKRQQTADEFAAAAVAAGKSAVTGTREAWLIKAVELLSGIFTHAGFTVPPVRISVGWPGGKSMKKLQSTIGQCWYKGSAADGVTQIFISPLLSDPAEILSTIMHELVHAVDEGKSGHKAGFKRIALLVGLEGKMTCAGAGAALRSTFPAVIAALGEYDHAKLSPVVKKTAANSNRQLKVLCDCGCIVRMSRKAIDEFGCPDCHRCHEQMYEV